MTGRHTASAALLILLLCGCNDTRRINAFTENGDIRLQVGGSVQFRYDPLTCQLSFSRDNRTFRASTDNTSDFFVAELSAIPTQLGETVTADLEWTSPTDVLSRKNLTLEVVRIEGENIWLWSSSGRIGLSMRILE